MTTIGYALGAWAWTAPWFFWLAGVAVGIVWLCLSIRARRERERGRRRPRE